MAAPICLFCCKPVESSDGKCPCEDKPIDRYTKDVKDWEDEIRKNFPDFRVTYPCLGCNHTPCQCYEV